MTARFHSQAATVPLAPDRPLVIVDADEVLLRFADGFDRFLHQRQLFLDLVSYRLHGNVRRQDDRTALLDVEVTVLLDEFRSDLDWLDAVEGAQDAIAVLREISSVVVLSNVSENQADARLRNLASLRMDVPLVINSGPKGPHVRALTARSSGPAFFIDDIPQHHASVAEAAPEVSRIHFIGDARLKHLLPISPHADYRADTWKDAIEYIHTRLTPRV